MRELTAIVLPAGLLCMPMMAGCSVSTVGEETVVDASVDTGADAARDSRPTDTAEEPTSDAGEEPAPIGCSPLFACGATCVSSCFACDAGNVQCNGNRTCGDCSDCAQFPVACFNCNAGHPVGFCAVNATACSNPSVVQCPCGADAGACPGANQVCDHTSTCSSCGQSGSDGLPCANGKVCNQQSGMCQ